MPNDPNGDEPIVIELDNTGEGNTVKFENDDIKDGVLRKIGEYITKQTEDNHNSPTLVESVREISIRSASGKPAALTNSDSVEADYLDSFESDQGSDAVSSFRRLSNSGQLDLDVRKGKVDSTAKPTIGSLIEDVNANGENSQLSLAVQNLQIENNRYAKNSEYIPLNQSNSEEDLDIGRVVLQTDLGVHTPRKFPNAQGDREEISFGIKKLKNLGLQTLLEASGEYFIPDDTEDFASLVAAKAASTAPGLARLGVRVPVSRFSAATIANQVDGNFQKSSRFPELDGQTMFSHGNPNNPLVPFDAISSTSSGVAAILLTITISKLVQALAAVTEPESIVPGVPSIPDIGASFAASYRSSADPADVRKKRLGSYLGKDVRPNSASTLGSFIDSVGSNFFLLNPTQYPYARCVSRGAKIFFGENGSLESQLLGALGASVGFDTGQYRQVSQSPGYFNVLLRMLVKATTESIGSAINTVVGFGANIIGETNPIGNTAITKGPLDVNPNIGLSNDPTNILNVINSIRNSKIFKFMDVLATLGDIGLMIDERYTGESFLSTIDAVNDFIEVDGKEYYFPNPAAIIKKNRLTSNVKGRYSDNLAWGSSTLRSLYMMPTTSDGAEKVYTGGTRMTSYLNSNPNFKLSSKKRLLPEDVAAIEDELDSYYMPFYFHDLRTNEVVSFHAFIESITDSHDAEYAESDGYGRIGKIYTYKNTNRTIGCSFKVVSTNENDFAEMWYKINRFVTMVYPQYTAGRDVSYTADGVPKKFIQPFSQLIGNSPMIRFRLGDLIKTNFSDFDLARLFGVGTDKFDVRKFSRKDYEAGEDKAQEILNRIYDYEFETGDIFNIINEESVGSRKSQTKILQFSNSSGRIPKLPSEIRVEVVKWFGAKKYEVKLSPPIDGIDDNLIADFTGYPSNIYVREDWDYIDRQVDQRRLESFSEPENQDSLEQREQVDKFFSPDNNPIVRSFDSVKGQGLAGFIKRISFDWADARWQTEGLNNRAPMWCKIDIDFAPVNDINPGLDSSGAPIGLPYNVGSILKLMKIKRSGAEDSDSIKSTNYAARKAQASTPTNNVDGDDERSVLSDFPGGGF